MSDLTKRAAVAAGAAVVLALGAFAPVAAQAADLPPGSAGTVPASGAQLVAAGGSTSPWMVQKAPKPFGSALSDVSCVSAKSCVAVGDYENSEGFDLTLAEVWNGAAWKIEKTPNPSGSLSSTLSGVSCTSTASKITCTAVGDFTRATSPELTLAEVWNGATWKIEKTPNPHGSTGSGFSSVSCAVASRCTAVGSYDDTYQLVLAEVWNGATWKIEKTPTPRVSGESGGGLSSVSCGSASACAAVGYSGVLNTSFSEAWDGKTWTIQHVPNPMKIGGSNLYSVSCTSPTSCTAVGSFLHSSFVDTTLAEVWNGVHWKIQKTPNPPRREISQLLGVSCIPRACTAIGYSELSWTTLAEVWNGSTWKFQKIPNQANQADKLTGVSCTSAITCIAVGSSVSGVFVEAK